MGKRVLVDGLNDADVGDGGGLLAQQLDVRVQDRHVRRFGLLQNRNWNTNKDTHLDNKSMLSEV